MSGKKGGNQKKDQGGEKKFEFNFDAPQETGEKGDRKPVLDLAGKDAHLVGAMQGKLAELVGKSSGYLETLSKPVQDRIKALKKIHADQNQFQEEFEKAVQELQKKFDAQVKPLYERRATIIKGEQEPNEEELKFVPEGGEPTPNPNVPPVEDKGEKGIPQFWLTALQHNPLFMDMITERDEEVLKHLIDVREVPIEGEEDSFRLEFAFTPNEYFENDVLFKTYHVDEEADEPLTLEASEIKWKTGKNITVKMVKVQQQSKGGRGGRGGKRGGKQGGGKPQTITMEKKCDSFFNFFTEDPLDGLDLEEEDDPQEIMEMDYNVGVELKEEIIPNAVMWFTGEAEIDPMFGGIDMEEGDGDDDDDEEGDDDFEPPRDANGNPVENPQQCQQQ